LRGIDHSEVLGGAQQSQRYEAEKDSDCEDGLFNEPEKRPEQGDILVDGFEDDVNAPEQYDDRRVNHQIAGKAESKHTFRTRDIRRGLARVLHDQPAADKGFAEDGQSHLDEIKEPDDFGSAMLCRRDRSRYYFGSV
jgi:hypothetical protein